MPGRPRCFPSWARSTRASRSRDRGRTTHTLFGGPGSSTCEATMLSCRGASTSLSYCGSCLHRQEDERRLTSRPSSRTWECSTGRSEDRVVDADEAIDLAGVAMLWGLSESDVTTAHQRYLIEAASPRYRRRGDR